MMYSLSSESTIPPAIARYYTTSLSRMMLLSVAIGISISVSGLFLSYVLDIASGATIILLGSAVLLCVLAVRKIREARNGKG